MRSSFFSKLDSDSGKFVVPEGYGDGGKFALFEDASRYAKAELGKGMYPYLKIGTVPKGLESADLNKQIEQMKVFIARVIAKKGESVADGGLNVAVIPPGEYLADGRSVDELLVPVEFGYNRNAARRSGPLDINKMHPLAPVVLRVSGEGIKPFEMLYYPDQDPEMTKDTAVLVWNPHGSEWREGYQGFFKTWLGKACGYDQDRTPLRTVEELNDFRFHFQNIWAGDRPGDGFQDVKNYLHISTENLEKIIEKIQNTSRLCKLAIKGAEGLSPQILFSQSPSGRYFIMVRPVDTSKYPSVDFPVEWYVVDEEIDQFSLHQAQRQFEVEKEGSWKGGSVVRGILNFLSRGRW